MKWLVGLKLFGRGYSGASVHSSRPFTMEPQSDLDTEWLLTILKRSIHDDTPVITVDLKMESAVPKGYNYSSFIKRVQIRMITAGGSKKTFSIIVKEAITGKKSDKIDDKPKGHPAFRNEIRMFTTTLHHMQALVDEFEDKRPALWPKLYGYVPYNSLVMEDLKARNFILSDRTGWLNLDRSLLVLRCLGRYHAMTKILIGRALISEDDVVGYMFGKNSTVKSLLLNGPLHLLGQAMIKKAGHWPSGWEDIGKRLEIKASGILCDTLHALSETRDSKFDVLNHGDLWSSNMMFKEMEYTGVTTDVIFLDYQLPHIGSFMWDVTYFMYTSIKPSVRRSHKDKLLQAYHESLTDNLKFYQWQGYVPTLDDVMSEANRLLPAALTFEVCLMPIGTASTQNAFALEKLMSHPPEEVYNEEIFCEEKYVTEISDDIKNFAKLGII